MRQRLFLALLGTLLSAGIAAAQTGTPTPPPTTTTGTGTTTTSGGGTTTTDPNKGAFDKLSPGNQKIAQALYDAQRNSDVPPDQRLSRDDIAAMKRDGKGWGNVFKTLKEKGLVTEKNLGQVVSRSQHQQRGITTRRPDAASGSGSGKTGTTSGGSASSATSATRGRGQGGYKSTGSDITTGSNQTSTEGHGPLSHGAASDGGKAGRGGAGAGSAGSQGGGHGQRASIQSGGTQGGANAAGGAGRGKR
jgi:hypothetical protein